MEIKKLRNDIILLAIIIIVALSIFIFYRQSLVKGNTVVVYYDNNVIYKSDISKDITKKISTPLGVNELVIKNGKAKIICADCKDQLCVYQKSIDKVGENIICLPHKLIIKIEGEKGEMDIDSISN